MPFMIDGKFHGIITGFWEELPTGVIISIWEILENPRGILAALNSIGNLCWWADFCPWKHCSNMCALAAFPIFLWDCCVFLLEFYCVWFWPAMFFYICFLVCGIFVGIVTVFASGWLFSGPFLAGPCLRFYVMCLLHFVGFCVIVWNLWDYCGVCFWFAQNNSFWMHFLISKDNYLNWCCCHFAFDGLICFRIT